MFLPVVLRVSRLVLLVIQNQSSNGKFLLLAFFGKISWQKQHLFVITGLEMISPWTYRTVDLQSHIKIMV